MEMDLSVDLGKKIVLKNPTVLASGVLGTSKALLERISTLNAGAVTIKSISLNPRIGHENPTILDFGKGTINAVGYSNPGLAEAMLEFSDLTTIDCPVFGSIIGTTLDEFKQIAASFDKLEFGAIEVPVSCPHTPGFGKFAKQDTPDAIFSIVSAICDNTSKPVFVKLPPASNNLIEMATAAKEGGAYGITAVNTVGPGMLIDAEFGKPVLGFGVGGISGPALKPLALAAVFELYKNLDMPIIGTGGITTGIDAIEMIMAGATAIGIGTAFITRGLNAMKLIEIEMLDFMKRKNIYSLRELQGVAHG